MNISLILNINYVNTNTCIFSHYLKLYLYTFLTGVFCYYYANVLLQKLRKFNQLIKINLMKRLNY